MADKISDFLHEGRIRPGELEFNVQPDATPGNIDRFLDSADVVVDSLDFYCFKERLLLYPRARQKVSSGR